MMKYRALYVAALTPFLMGNDGGCQTTSQPTVVRVVTDNYCRLTDKMDWSVLDTQESIEHIRKSEAKRVCTCVKPRPKSCPQKDPKS